MATTSPDNIQSPDPGDPYNLVPDLATLANDVQDTFTLRGNMFVGTSAERAAMTTAPAGAHWQDTDGDQEEYIWSGSVWDSLGVNWVEEDITLTGLITGYRGTLSGWRRGRERILTYTGGGSSSSFASGISVISVPTGLPSIWSPASSGIFFGGATGSTNSSGVLRARGDNNSLEIINQSGATRATYSGSVMYVTD